MFRNKLLALSFIASFALNATLLALVGNSGLFQQARAANDLRAQQIEIYKPPIAEKIEPPKPVAPHLKPVPPAHPVTQPKNLPHPPQPAPVARPTVYQKPNPQPIQPAPHSAVLVRPQPAQPARPAYRPAPHPSAPPHTITAPPIAHPAVNFGSHSARGSVATPAAPPSTAPVFHPDPAPQPATPHTEVATPAPAPDPAPSKPVEQPRPRPHPELPDRAYPEPDTGSWPALQLPSDVDASSLSSTTIEITLEVDKTGRPRHIHVKRSSGNSEVDNLAYEMIQQMRFKPAVQNGEPQDVEQDHTIEIGN